MKKSGTVTQQKPLSLREIVANTKPVTSEV